MDKLTVKEAIYLRSLLEQDKVEIQADINGGADKDMCERDLKANESLLEKLNKYIGENYY